MARKKLIEEKPGNTDNISSLHEVVEESKNELAAAAQIPPKSKRGRPSGSTKNPMTDQSPGLPSGQPLSLIPPGPSPIRPAIEGAFEFCGSYMANVSEYDGFIFQKEELKLLTDQADEVCKEFVPQVQSKWAKLTAFVGTTAIIVGKKYMGYQKFVMDKIHKDNMKEEKEILSRV